MGRDYPARAWAGDGPQEPSPLGDVRPASSDGRTPAIVQGLGSYRESSWPSWYTLESVVIRLSG